jgi:thiamine-phosphate diphosphorylase
VRPVICMITAPQESTPDAERALVRRIEVAARAGVHLVQIRQPGYEARALTRLADSAVRAVAGTATRVLVNDRADVALAAGAHGVHLRGDSMPAARVRVTVPAGFLIGRSVHASDEAQTAWREGGLDYLIFGTVFRTSSKPDRDASGGAALASVCAAVPLPVLAIGGITAERLGEVARAGAAGFAAITLFAACAVDALPSVVDRARRLFDGGSNP